jgi:hypothetical protein
VAESAHIERLLHHRSNEQGVHEARNERNAGLRPVCHAGKEGCGGDQGAAGESGP